MQDARFILPWMAACIHYCTSTFLCIKEAEFLRVQTSLRAHLNDHWLHHHLLKSPVLEYFYFPE